MNLEKPQHACQVSRAAISGGHIENITCYNVDFMCSESPLKTLKSYLGGREGGGGGGDCTEHRPAININVDKGPFNPRQSVTITRFFVHVAFQPRVYFAPTRIYLDPILRAAETHTHTHRRTRNGTFLHFCGNLW